MIIGIGIDIIETARFKEITDHFVARVFTHNERAYFLRKGHISTAGIFAAKEAVSKALGTGFSNFWPSDIEVMHNDMGKPYVVLHGNAAQIAKKLSRRRQRYNPKYEIKLSISHTETDAIAVAVFSTK